MKSMILVTVGLVVIFVPALVYALPNINDIGFLDSFVSSLLATMIALILGIPIALSISTRERASQEQLRKHLEAQQESEQRAKILSLIKNELETDLNLITELRRLDKYDSEGWHKSRLRDEFWRAFSDGGELRWIRDVELLSIIAGAYHHISPLIILHDGLTRTNMEGTGVRYSDTRI